MKINKLIKKGSVLLSILLLSIFSQAFAQTLATINQPGIALNPTDAFNFMNNSVGFYGLGWYRETENTPPVGYLSGFSGLKFFTTGSPRMVLDAPGNLGIGTSSPISRLNIVGGDESITLGDHSASLNPKGIYFPGFRDILPNYFGTSIEAVPEWACCDFPGSGYPGIKNVGLNFNVHGNYGFADDKVTALSINANGNIGIGTTTPRERLSVNGNIRAKEIKVEASDWPDYVFAKDYHLPDLQETKRFIKHYGHLPEMPSASKVAVEGHDLGEIQIKLLKKMEELTLHLINLEEMNNRQAKQISGQSKQIEKQHTEIAELRNIIKGKK